LIKSAEFVAISSDLSRRSSFECSVPLLNKLHENVVWSQRDNFVSVPTDCPQRDERLGWTGDAQAFAATSCTLFDSEAFWANWLEDLAADQHPELGVATVVPDVVLDGEPRFGRAGWADAATIVPWAVYESYGDAAILRQQFDSMTAWVDSLSARRGRDGLIEPGFQFGDWLDPDAPPARPWEAKADSQFLANAFFVQSARLAAEAGEVIGAQPDLVERLAELASEVATLTWDRWSDHIRETQTGCAIALRFDLVPDVERTAVVNALGEMVIAADGRISTGFLGTPLVLHALAEGDRLDEAYLMLLREQYPSWLYQVRSGATTVWERWDAIRADGSIHPGIMDPPDGDVDAEGGHMLSFNHYAYGAVVDWMYRYLAGISPDRRDPGYRRVLLAPKPVGPATSSDPSFPSSGHASRRTPAANPCRPANSSFEHWQRADQSSGQFDRNWADRQVTL
jgi:alpha-L-rhamnosidase